MLCGSTSAQRTRSGVLKRKSSRCMPLSSALLLVGDQRADTGIGEDFQQYRIGYPAVDDDGTADATLNGIQSATDLRQHAAVDGAIGDQDRKSTRLNSSHVRISYAVFCLKKKIYTTWS